MLGSPNNDRTDRPPPPLPPDSSPTAPARPDRRSRRCCGAGWSGTDGRVRPGSNRDTAGPAPLSLPSASSSAGLSSSAPAGPRLPPRPRPRPQGRSAPRMPVPRSTRRCPTDRILTPTPLATPRLKSSLSTRYPPRTTGSGPTSTVSPSLTRRSSPPTTRRRPNRRSLGLRTRSTPSVPVSPHDRCARLMRPSVKRRHVMTRPSKMGRSGAVATGALLTAVRRIVIVRSVSRSPCTAASTSRPPTRWWPDSRRPPGSPSTCAATTRTPWPTRWSPKGRTRPPTSSTPRTPRPRVPPGQRAAGQGRPVDPGPHPEPVQLARRGLGRGLGPGQRAHLQPQPDRQEPTSHVGPPAG